MPSWVIWLAVAGLLGAVEMTTLLFAAGLMASAAVVAAVVAGVGGPPQTQLLAFAAMSIASLGVAVPLARRRGLAAARYRSGVTALIDKPAVVVTKVDAVSGTVRIGGEVWSARAYDETLVMTEGASVSVYEIVGATALVYPREFT
jgi:membrane protein implicated in regulation of membrane protease activity